VIPVSDPGAGWQLAQVNVGRLIAALPDPRVAPFFESLDRINALADASPGFVWRLQDESGNATGIPISPDPLLAINMSVWTDAEALFEFVYRSAHTPEMARRKEYFERYDGAYQALWWIEAGTIPTVNDALSRLWLLDRFGPSPQAFSFKVRFPRPDEVSPPVDMNPDPWCAGRA
jgi:Domain of unknown function (DUF3291)